MNIFIMVDDLMVNETRTIQRESQGKRLKIGPYEIQGKPLGIGASANVYMAVDQFGQKFAIKELHPRNLTMQKAVKRFRQEFSVLKELEHPNVVEVVDFFQANGTYNLVMEYIDGVNLAVIIDRLGAMDVETAFTIAYICASCLDYIHSQGMVHRDLKPENIMITRQGELKITDFGIARLESMTLTNTGDFIGTPVYMAPEQIAGNVGSDIDERADIYSLGVMLYEMIKGKDPFDLKSCKNIYRVAKIVEQQHPPPLGLSDPEAEGVLFQMLARNPNDRCQNAAELSASLMPFSLRMSQAKKRLRELVTLAEGMKPRKKAGKKRKPRVKKVIQEKPGGLAEVDRRGWWALAVAVIVVLSILLTWLYLGQYNHKSTDSMKSQEKITISIDENLKEQLLNGN